MKKKGDIGLIVILLIVIFVGGYGVQHYRNKQSTGEKIAVIRQNNQVLRKINLNTVVQPERMTITGEYTETILIETGRIRFESADCPDKVCIKTGWLTNHGEMAVCLPNRTTIKIEGDLEKVDGTTY